MLKLERGRIIEAEVLDPQGKNPKRRRLVIVTPTDEIKEAEPLICVAITGTLPKPLTPEFVLLPYTRSGHPRTGLTKRCAAKCDWIMRIDQKNLLAVTGIVPGAELLEILERVDRLEE